MTTSTPVGVAISDVPDTPSPTMPSLYIVGFAPSYQETPWDDPEGTFWGLNNLHKMPGTEDRRWNAWFQLHDIDATHPNDRDEHIEWLRTREFPVIMWDEFIPKYPMIENAIPYPKQAILDIYGTYFTNSISWMIALGIEHNFKRIGIYGVDMAQNSEYESQRPSCEFFLGWARGKGIDITIPKTSDLLKTPYLYGIEDGSVMTAKYQARIKELSERRAEAERQRNQAHEAYLQLTGALEDAQYFKRVWSQEETARNGQ